MMGLCIFVLSYMVSLSPRALSIVNPAKTTRILFSLKRKAEVFFIKKENFVRAACLQLTKHDRALRIKGRVCQNIQRDSNSPSTSDNKFRTYITGAKFLVNGLPAQHSLTVKLVKPESYCRDKPTIHTQQGNLKCRTRTGQDQKTTSKTLEKNKKDTEIP